MTGRLFILLLVLMSLGGVRIGLWMVERPEQAPWRMPPMRPGWDDGIRTQAAERTPDRLRVLFIGNSFTMVNGGVHRALEQLTRQADRPVQAEIVARGGASLEIHWRAQMALRRIREGAWDFVVFQEHSQSPLEELEISETYLRLFAEEARRVGAEPVLFMTWARPDIGQDPGRVRQAFRQMEERGGVRVAPVGHAFAMLGEGAPIALLASDRYHPASAGTLLAALVVREVMAPAGGPATAPTTREADEAPDALLLQDLARRAVADWVAARPGGVQPIGYSP